MPALVNLLGHLSWYSLLIQQKNKYLLVKKTLSLTINCSGFKATLYGQVERSMRSQVCVYLLGFAALTSVILTVMSHMERSRRSLKLTVRAGVRVYFLQLDFAFHILCG